jgi:esterase/lipase
LEKKSSALTLKRTVTIKAIVTEDYKKYLAYEIQQSMNSAQGQVKAIEMGAQRQLDELSSQSGTEQQVQVVSQKLQHEQAQFQHTMMELNRRMNHVKTLELGQMFVQGTVDGWVSVTAGDNLYQKLGGMEIIIKDGIVQEILPAGMPASNR